MFFQKRGGKGVWHQKKENLGIKALTKSGEHPTGIEKNTGEGERTEMSLERRVLSGCLLGKAKDDIFTKKEREPEKTPDEPEPNKQESKKNLDVKKSSGAGLDQRKKRALRPGANQEKRGKKNGGGGGKGGELILEKKKTVWGDQLRKDL